MNLDWLLFFSILVLTGIAYWLYDKRTRRLLTRFQDITTLAFKSIEHRLRINAEGVQSIEGTPRIWAVITTYNRPGLLERTITSLRTHEPTVKILVVNNGSTDDTALVLDRLFQHGSIDLIVTNRHADVPQWQKGYVLHQAWHLLLLRHWSHWILLDDDIVITRPFLSSALEALDSLRRNGVRLVSLMTDEHQDHVHPTVHTATINGETYKLKRTFNGAFLVMPEEFFDDYGLPPVAEGINDLSTEDWYYSRLMTQRNELVACANAAEHLGNVSQREAMTLS
jgi:glycosyltransferase involved in cell wall biosynthesis